MKKIYETEPKMPVKVMGPEETKKCRVVPKKYNYIPDLLLNNKRIEEECTLDLNKNEIARAMSLAEVYEVKEDGEVLLDSTNYFISAVEDEEVKDGGETKEPEDGKGEMNTPPSTEDGNEDDEQISPSDNGSSNTEPQSDLSKSYSAIFNGDKY